MRDTRSRSKLFKSLLLGKFRIKSTEGSFLSSFQFGLKEAKAQLKQFSLQLNVRRALQTMHVGSKCAEKKHTSD